MKIANKMKYQNRITQHLQADLLRALPGLLPSLRITKADRASAAGADLVVEVLTPSGKRRRLYVETRSAATPNRIPHAMRQLKTEPGWRAGSYPVLASRFLSPRARELCREAGVGYLDLAGNCYLQFEDFLLQKIVDRNPFPQQGRPASLFSPVSSRLLRAMLEEPSRSWRVSELAAVAGASLGQTSNVCRRLVEEAYARPQDRRVQLVVPGRLLEAWRDASRVLPQARHAFYSFERDPEQLARRLARVGAERGWPYALTSFAAAIRVAPFVHGIGVVEWYVADAAALDGWVEALDLRPVESGPNVVLRVPDDPGVFYRAHAVDDVTVVGNVQLYLDLWPEPSRGHEQADFLRQERLRF